MNSFVRYSKYYAAFARVLALVATGWVACGGTVAHSQPIPSVIRFGVSDAGRGNPPRIVGGWPAVAQAKGYLEDEFRKDGIQIKWIFFKGQGPAVNEALTNNQIDFTTLGDLPSIIGRSVGIDTRIVLMTGSEATAYVAVSPKSSIRSIPDLRGKRISFLKGTASQLATNRILAAHGLSERDVRVVNLDPAESVAAFRSGELDAIFGGLGLLPLRDRGLARIIYSSKQDPSASSAGHVLVTGRFATQYPQITQRVVNALVRAAAWTSDERNREQVIDLWAQAGSITAANFREEYQGTSWALRLSPVPDAYAIERDRQSVDDAYRFRLIRRKFDVPSWVDRRYLDVSLKQAGLEHRWPSRTERGAVTTAK